MENVDKVDKKECGCGMHFMHGCGCHCGKHHLVKIILKIIIVILIFWCGFKLGNITGTIKAESGQHRMANNSRGNFGMMHKNYFNNMPTANPGTPTTPAPAK